MDLSIEKVIELNETKDFLLAAREFCVFIESNDKTDKEFLRQIQSLLLILYYHATTLSWTSLDHNKEFADKLSKAEQEIILKKISNKIVKDRFYWDVFDPTNDKDTEPVCGDLVDDLGDIYKEVKEGLLNFDLETMASKEKAAWTARDRRTQDNTLPTGGMSEKNKPTNKIHM